MWCSKYRFVCVVNCTSPSLMWACAHSSSSLRTAVGSVPAHIHTAKSVDRTSPYSCVLSGDLNSFFLTSKWCPTSDEDKVSHNSSEALFPVKVKREQDLRFAFSDEDWVSLYNKWNSRRSKKQTTYSLKSFLTRIYFISSNFLSCVSGLFLSCLLNLCVCVSIKNISVSF